MKEMPKRQRDIFALARAGFELWEIRVILRNVTTYRSLRAKEMDVGLSDKEYLRTTKIENRLSWLASEHRMKASFGFSEVWFRAIRKRTVLIRLDKFSHITL